MAPLNFVLDKAGFPMVWVPAIGAYLHWLPVTKVQFEHFLCDPFAAQFDEPWYNMLLGMNERVSPLCANRRNYWQLFITGVTPTEAGQFATWCGHEYRLPTLDEWNRAYQTLKVAPCTEIPDLGAKSNERARLIVSEVDAITRDIYQARSRPRTLADQMLMRLGVMEWVRYDYRGLPWGGMGQTDPAFQSMLRTPDTGMPEVPRAPKQQRLKYYGFRLLRR
jgi:formylglycine-generating enzyme required for sulfatase activity